MLFFLGMNHESFSRRICKWHSWFLVLWNRLYNYALHILSGMCVHMQAPLFAQFFHWTTCFIFRLRARSRITCLGNYFPIILYVFILFISSRFLHTTGPRNFHGKPAKVCSTGGLCWSSCSKLQQCTVQAFSMRRKCSKVAWSCNPIHPFY